MSREEPSAAADAGRAQAILEERARALARPPVEESAAERLDVVLFSLSGETYAAETRFVRAIQRSPELTRLPGTPPILIGVTNLRGEVLPVFDLRILLGVPAKGLPDLARLIVLGDDENDLGILADESREVRRLPRREIFEAAAPLATAARDLLLGVTADAVIVLDGAAVLRDRRLFVQGQDRRPAEELATR
jgi:purine-binding chemotaxis protein CheW